MNKKAEGRQEQLDFLIREVFPGAVVTKKGQITTISGNNRDWAISLRVSWNGRFLLEGSVFKIQVSGVLCLGDSRLLETPWFVGTSSRTDLPELRQNLEHLRNLLHDQAVRILTDLKERDTKGETT